MNLSLGSQDDFKSFKKNQFVYMKGDESDNLYLVKQGRVLLFNPASKRVIPLGVSGPETIFGEVEVFQDIPRYCHAFTLEYTELIVVSKRDILSVLNLCPQWVSNIMETLAGRLQSIGDLLAEHKITDDRFSEGASLTPADEGIIWKILGK